MLGTQPRYARHPARPAAGALAGPVTIRPGCPADRAAIRDFISGLSPRTRLDRFFAGVSPPSGALLRGLTGGERSDVLLATAGPAVIGHAMAVRTAPERQVIEVGLVVADAWQGNGIGSVLMRELVSRARAAGISAMEMDVLPGNRRMLAMIERNWPGSACTRAAGSVRIRAPLDGPAQPAYSASMTSAYLACITRRLSLSVGVSSSLSAVHSTGSSRHRFTC
jgi:GNAT superfamily N-acetyltransferase